MDEQNIPKYANVMGSIFALTVKHADNAQGLEKARLLVQGHTAR